MNAQHYTAADKAGMSVTSPVDVTVAQTVTGLVVAPPDATIAAPGTTYYYFVKACSGAVCGDFGAWDVGFSISAVYAQQFESGVGG